MSAIKEKRVCPWCGKEFFPSPEHKKYCSSECQKLSEVIQEIDKCIILCSNCRKELHGGLWSLEGLK